MVMAGGFRQPSNTLVLPGLSSTHPPHVRLDLSDNITAH